LAWNSQAEGGVRGVYLGSLSIGIKCPYWRCSYSSLRGAACKTEMLICNIGSSAFFSFFFWGESFAKFRPEKYDFHLFKGFFMEK
jgi:hypothetical protein